MRKFLLSLCLFCLCIAGKAEIPAITLTSASSGALSFDLSFSSAGPFFIDWGDGTLDPQTAIVGYASYSTSSYSAEDTVKVYGLGITVFNVNSKNLTSLDVSACTTITNLNCGSNQLTSLDVSNNTALTNLWCSENQLETLNVTTNTALTALICNNNQLKTLDLKNNTLLTGLNCGNNQLDALDVTNNTALINLLCDYNKLSYATLPQKKPGYTNFYYSPQGNLAASATNGVVDLSSQLTAKDVSNVTQTTVYKWYTQTSNTLLARDVDYTEAGGVFTFMKPLSDNVYCTMENDAFPDLSNPFELRTENLNVEVVPAITLTSTNNGTLSFDLAFNAAGPFYIDWGNGTLVPQTANTLLTIYSTSSYNTGDTVKIYGSGIKALDVISQNLTSLDVSACTTLTELQCYSNQLTALDVSMNTALTSLNCLGNQLIALDVSKNTALTILYCFMNQIDMLDLSKNASLSVLYCFGNKLTMLNLSNTTALTELNCAGNILEDLDLSTNTALAKLYCSNNEIDTLDLSNKTALTELQCYSNQLTALNLSNNTALTELYCNNNKLENLDLSTNTALTRLSCYSNQLTALDISKNTALTYLDCSGNQLNDLNLINNTALTKLYCPSNQLNYATLPQKKPGYVNYNYAPQANLAVSVTNGVVDLSSQLTAKDVSNVTQTTVYKWYAQTSNTLLARDVDYTEAVGVFTFMKPLSDNVYCTMENDAFPDLSNPFELRTENLEVEVVPAITLTSTSSGALSFDLAFNAAGPFYIDWGNGTLVPQTANTSITNYSTASYTKDNTVKVYGSGITELYALSQNLTSLEVSACKELTLLACYANQIKALNVSKNTVLTELHCEYNQLTELDVSKNLELTNLACVSNQINALDVSKNSALKYLSCAANPLTALYLTNNTALINLYCDSNQLTELDVSKNIALTHLYCSGNQLTALNLINNTALTILNCNYNQLNYATLPQKKPGYVNYSYAPQANIAASVNGIVVDLSSQLTAKDVSGDIQTTAYTWYTQSGTALALGTDYTEAGGVFTFMKPPSESVYCTMNNAAFPDLVGANVLRTVNLKVVPAITFASDNNGDLSFDLVFNAPGTFFIDWGDGILISQTANTSITNYSTASYTKDNTVKIYSSGIIEFSANYQNLTSLDVSDCSTLAYLFCVSNQLTSLDVSKNTALTYLNFRGNQLTALDLSNNTALTELLCDDNKLEDLDVSTNTVLTGLYCGNNQLTLLDVRNNTALTRLFCYSNQLEVLDLSTNTILTRLSCFSNQLTALDLSNNTALIDLVCWDNKLEDLNVSTNTALAGLYCDNNQLTVLDVRNNTMLTDFVCSSNQLNYATLPQKKSGYTNYWYSPQANLAASVTNGVVDLSSQLTAKDVSGDIQTTAYTWYTKSGTALALGTDYTEAGGVFTFLKNPSDSVYCTMENAAFPKFTGADVLRTVNLEVIVCTNPISGGTIAANQSGCYPFDPEEITSSTLLTGNMGTLEYKWQHSTTSATAGFTDIASTNAATYNPGALDTTTWFKRLARVECMADWTGAVESNVVKITVYQLPNAPVAGANTYTYNGTSRTASATVGIGETVDWYASATGATKATAPTGMQANTYSAYAEARNTTTGCVSAKRTLITLDIKQAPLTVTADNKNRLYGKANPVLTFSYSGFSVGEDSSTLDVLPVVSTLATRDSDVGSYDIVVSGGSGNNYDIVYKNGKLTIEQGNLNIFAERKTMRYGDSIPELTLRYEFFDTVGTVSGLDHVITAWVNTDSITGPGTYPIHISGGKDNNYAIFYFEGTLTIEKALLKVTAQDKSITYGEPLPELTYTIEGFLNGDKDLVLSSKPTIAVNRGAGVNAGSYEIIASGGFDEFYDFDYQNGKLTVNKAQLTAATASVSSVVGVIPSLHVFYSGFVNDETKDVIDTLAFAVTAATKNSPSGAYPISVSGGYDNNYNFTYTNGQLTLIEKVTPTLTWEPSNLTYGEKLGESQLNATSSIKGSFIYEPVAGTLLESGEKQELKVTFVPFDSVSINKASKSVYVDVQKAVLTVKANDKTISYGDTLQVLSFSYSGFVNDENAGVLDILPTIKSIDGVAEAGTYPIVVSGGSDNNYSFVYEKGILTVKAKQHPVVTWANPSDITYGTALGATQLNAKANVAGTFTYTPSTGTVLAAGKSQLLIARFTPADTLTYAVVTDTALINVIKAPLTVTADNAEMKAGETVPEFTFDYSGFVNGDDKSDIDKLPVATSTASSTSKKGEYKITVSGGEDNNYSFIYKSGNLIVNSGVGVDALKSISMSVYPNPFTDKVTISSEFNGDGSYQLTDLTGKVISNGQVEDGNTNIMLSHIRKGVYLLQVKMGEGNRTFRLVKE